MLVLYETSTYCLVWTVLDGIKNHGNCFFQNNLNTSNVLDMHNQNPSPQTSETYIRQK